jgi:hypothetical protein
MIAMTWGGDTHTERRAAMTATVKLRRKHPGVELRRGPFEIELDGTSVGSLAKRDETVEIPVEPGHHTLRIRSGRYSSDEEPFDVAGDEVVNFHTRGPLFWPAYVASLVKPDHGVKLTAE